VTVYVAFDLLQQFIEQLLFEFLLNFLVLVFLFHYFLGSVEEQVANMKPFFVHFTLENCSHKCNRIVSRFHFKFDSTW